MKKLALILSLLFISFTTTSAQCSDAGVCSIGGHALGKEATPFELSLGYSYGYSGKEDDISYNSINLSGSYQFIDQAAFNFDLPFSMQSGPWGNVQGIGDLLLSFSYGLQLDESSISVSAGMILPTSEENKENVPQPYRSGLGTTDALLGIEYSYSNFSIGTGYQIAGKPEDDLLSVERGDDLLLRAGYMIDFENFSINPQLLFIKRLSKSKMYFFSSDPAANSIPMYLEVPESDQSQLNLLVNSTYKVDEVFSLFAEAAIPFLERDVNVDGLKRTFSFSAGLSFGF